MRLTLLLMLGFCVSALSNGCGTKREDRKQHQTLETVFEQVESQTGLLDHVQ